MGKRAHQFAAADVEQATIADGLPQEPIGRRSRRPRRRPVQRPATHNSVEKAPCGSFARWNQARLLVSIISLHRLRRSRSQAAKASASSGSGGSASTASVSRLAQGAEKIDEETPSAMTASPRAASVRQASWYSCGCSGSLAIWKTRVRSGMADCSFAAHNGVSPQPGGGLRSHVQELDQTHHVGVEGHARAPGCKGRPSITAWR